jgi:hypothetical protein
MDVGLRVGRAESSLPGLKSQNLYDSLAVGFSPHEVPGFQELKGKLGG